MDQSEASHYYYYYYLFLLSIYWTTLWILSIAFCINNGDDHANSRKSMQALTGTATINQANRRGRIFNSSVAFLSFPLFSFCSLAFALDTLQFLWSMYAGNTGH
jgi:hypothetical protein